MSYYKSNEVDLYFFDSDDDDDYIDTYTNTYRNCIYLTRKDFVDVEYCKHKSTSKYKYKYYNIITKLISVICANIL